MSVIVKGMEMPQKCGQCKLFHAEHPMHCMAVEGHRTVGAPYGMPRPDWCPLVEIPTPHGRLGDLDKLEEQFKRAIETYIPTDPTRHMDVVTSNRCHAWCNGLTAIQDAPTVIEGSET